MSDYVVMSQIYSACENIPFEVFWYVSSFVGSAYLLSCASMVRFFHVEFNFVPWKYCDQIITESQKQSYNALQADYGHFKINISIQKDKVI